MPKIWSAALQLLELTQCKSDAEINALPDDPATGEAKDGQKVDKYPVEKCYGLSTKYHFL